MAIKVKTKNKIMKKIPILSASYFWLALALSIALVSGCSCSAPKPTPDPLAGWTFKPFPGSELPPFANNTNHLDKAIIDDYQDFITNNKLILFGAMGGYFEDGNGQHAVEFTAFPPDSNSTWNYVIIYNKENKRIKLIKYGYRQFQS
jgi:hypothetical protein